MQPEGVTAGTKRGELIHNGSVRFDAHDVIYAGPNPFR
jgi:hypothetical protein